MVQVRCRHYLSIKNEDTMFTPLLICFLSINTTINNTETKFSTYLYSTNCKDVEKSYYYIVNHKTAFSDLIYRTLKYHATHKSKYIPDRLIYIATANREERFYNQLIKISNNKQYTFHACIYSCPIVLAISFYICFDGYNLPRQLDSIANIGSDIQEKIDYINYHIHDTLIGFPDSTIDENMLEQNIALAGPHTRQVDVRMRAVDYLHDNICTSKYLKQLYWLAIMDINDEANEYRSLIYIAIIRAEIAQYNGK